MTTPEALATLREALPFDYLGPDPNDMDGEKWGQSPEALSALALLEQRLAELEKERDAALYALHRHGHPYPAGAAHVERVLMNQAAIRLAARLAAYERVNALARDARIDLIRTLEGHVILEMDDPRKSIALAELDALAVRLAAYERVVEAAEMAAAKQPEALAMIESNGFVFTDIGKEPGNWQHLAFSLYTELCEIESHISPALAALKEQA